MKYIHYFLLWLISLCGCTHVHEVPPQKEKIDSIFINNKAYIIKTNDNAYLLVKDTLNNLELKDVKTYIYTDQVTHIFGSPVRYSNKFKSQLKMLQEHLDKEKEMRQFYKENPTILRSEKQREYWDNYKGD